MSPLVVAIPALRRAAEKESAGALRDAAHLDIDQLERRLWAEKIRPGERFSLSLARQAAGVEFGLWALKSAESADSADKGAPDRYGRIMATLLIWNALTWLDAATLTNHEVTHAHAQDLINDVLAGKVAENHGRWIGWLELIDRLAREQAGWDWAGRALIAAVWCGQTIVAPAPLKKQRSLPTARTLARLGRHCAHAAYDNLMYAWVTTAAGFRAAHEIADLGANGARRNALMDARLAELDDHLRLAADVALKHTTEDAWNRVMEVKL